MRLTFDDPSKYQYEPGIEVVNSEMRLVDPNQATPLAAYWQIIIEGEIIAANALHSYSNYVDGIPFSIYRKEPTFDEIRNTQDMPTLDNMWDVLAQYEPGVYYMGVLLGGMTTRKILWPFYNPNAYWSFDDDTANESQGLGYNGTITNVNFINTTYGRGAELTSTSSRINFGHYAAFDLNGDLTISLNYTPRSFSARANIIDKSYAGEYSLVQETNGKITFYHGTSTSNYEGFNSSFSLSLNIQSNIIIARDVTNYKLYFYVDGSLIDTFDTTITPAATSATLYLGQGYTGNASVGVYDEFLLYPYALNTQQIDCVSDRIHCLDTEVVPTGQMSIQEIMVDYQSSIAYAGNVIKEKAVAYKGSSDYDTLVHLDNLDEATSDYSNILLTRDREKLDYIILREGSGESDIILRTPDITQDNIIIRINDSYDASWQSSDLYGAGLDFKTAKNARTFGPARRLTDTWELTKSAGILWEVSEVATDLVFVVKKNILEATDAPRFVITLDDGLVLPLTINDNDEYIKVLNIKEFKPDMPWTTKYIKFHFHFMQNKITLYINNILIGYIDKDLKPKKVTLEVVHSTIQLKGSYLGRLASGLTEIDDQDQLEQKILATGEINGLGDMFYAGNRNINSIHKLHIVQDYIYKDKKLYAKTPGVDMTDPVICGIRDAVSLKEILFYGSKTEFDHIYIYEDEAWRIYEQDMKLFGIWRSLHTEGLVIQRKGETSIKIYLFTRDESKQLVYKRDISFTGLPYTESKFELNMDRRKLSRSVPWVWAEDEGLMQT